MIELLGFIQLVVHMYQYVVIIAVILSWLIGFNVVNAYNPIVRTIWQGVNALTEPLLRPIRRRMPDLGGLDISPVILLLGCIGVADYLIPFLIRKFA